jgi:DNA-nicking Smr family endonuclease
MDFGDILDKWEKQQSGGGAKKSAQSRTGAGSETAASGAEARVNPIEAWLRVNGVSDKDAETQEDRQSAAERRRRLRAKKSDAVLDIHGLTTDEAWEALERFFESAAKDGLVKILVIHGKGNHSKGDAVLGGTVRRFIERCPIAGESGHEKAVNGGSGATWVLLKNPSPP